MSTASPRTKDFDLRAALVTTLLQCGVPRAAIRHETTLDTSSSDGRADVVLPLDHAIIGFEIKSGTDTLERLPSQIVRYGSRFDRLVLVCDRRHQTALDKTYEFQRGWRFIFDADFAEGLTTIKPRYWAVDDAWTKINRATLRGRSLRTSPYAMLELLWADEIAEAAFRLKLPSTGARWSTIPNIGDMASLREIRAVVAELLRERRPNRWEQEFWRRFDADPAQANVSPALPVSPITLSAETLAEAS